MGSLYMDFWRRVAGAAPGQGAGDRCNERINRTDEKRFRALALWREYQEFPEQQCIYLNVRNRK